MGKLEAIRWIYANQRVDIICYKASKHTGLSNTRTECREIISPAPSDWLGMADVSSSSALPLVGLRIRRRGRAGAF